MDLDEAEALGGGGRSNATAVAGLEEERDVGEGTLMAPHFEEGADDVAHHFIEKSVCLELKAEERMVVQDVEAGEGSDGIA